MGPPLFIRVGSLHKNSVSHILFTPPFTPLSRFWQGNFYFNPFSYFLTFLYGFLGLSHIVYTAVYGRFHEAHVAFEPLDSFGICRFLILRHPNFSLLAAALW